MGISKQTCERIKAMYNAGYSCKEIAETFGISENMVQAVCNHD